MIDAQTWLVAVAACVVIAAVWAWGIVREDASTARAHASGIELGRALERTAARGAIVAGTTTPRPALPMPGFSDAIDYVRPIDGESESLADPAPSTLSAGGGEGQPGATARREIPAWLREPGGSSDGSR